MGLEGLALRHQTFGLGFGIAIHSVQHWTLGDQFVA